jgi:putative membrane protein insertion efficiency factor
MRLVSVNTNVFETTIVIDLRKEKGAAGGPGMIARAMRIGVRAYQLTLSSVMGRHCRHLPTCSEYAYQAIGKHGAWAGFWLALFRLARCHPWGSAGFDPVPDRIVRFSFNLGLYRRAGLLDVSRRPNDKRGRRG